MDRLARVVVVALVAIALAIGAVAFWDARSLVGKPWAGFPVLPNGEVGPPILTAHRLANHPDLPRFQERVVALNGEAVEGRGSLLRKLDGVGAGAKVGYTIRAADGALSDRTFVVPRFERADLRALMLPLTIGGLLGLLLGVVPVLARPRLLVGWLFFLLNVGLSVNFGFLTLDWFVVHRFVPWGVIAGAMASGCLLHLAFLMPAPIGPARTHPQALAWAIYVLNGAFWAWLGVAVLREPDAMRWLDYGEMALFAVIAATLLVNLIRVSFWEKDQLVRRQGVILLLGLALVSIPGGLLFPAITLGAFDVRLPVAVYLLPLWFLGVLVTYVMVAHNLFELDALVRRGVAVAMIVLAALLAQAGLFVLLSPVLRGVTAWAVAGTMVMLAVATLSVLAPLRDGAEALVESLFFPRQRAARAAVHEASRRLVRLHGESEIVQVLRDAARDGMMSSQAQLLVGEQGGPMAEMSPVAVKAALTLSLSDPLRNAIVRGSTAALRQASDRRGGASRAVLRRLEEIGAEMVVPLPASQGMCGALVLAPRTDGRLYTRDDEILAETLAAQAAIALEHARAWSSVQALEDRLRAENLYLREEVAEANAATGEMVGQSAALRAVLAKVERAAVTDAPILVIGETGTGKELLVRALHARSARRDRIIVKVACAALPETLLESELFGYERGAFTGATTAKPGRFEVADGGTLFLDDVDTLPLGVQAKLLRALQEGELQRLGSNRTRHVDVRVVAATNRDLLAEVHAGRFREDLYYRLNVVPLELPPLRERAEDIPALVERFIRSDGARLNPTVRAISAEAMEALKRYHWPGNIRELRNVVQRSLVLSTDDVLRLPGPLEPGGVSTAASSARASGAADQLADGTPLSDRVRDLKIQLIRGALSRSGGNQRIAAEMLGMHRQALTRMIRDLGLQEPRDSGPSREST